MPKNKLRFSTIKNQFELLVHMQYWPTKVNLQNDMWLGIIPATLTLKLHGDQKICSFMF
jgi:hypothetical protein